MNTGMLWFDNDPKTALTAKIERAVDYYHKKYGHKPNLCLIHPTALEKSGEKDKKSKTKAAEPMKKVNGKFRQVSWDEALGVIADKLNDVKEKEGARSMVVHLGFPFIGTAIQRLSRRFCQVYGSPNFTTGASICFCARMIAQSITFNHHTTVLSPSYYGSQCLVLWGVNLTESGVLQARAVSRARKEGAKLIVIDPRVIPLAKKADIHARIRPGTC